MYKVISCIFILFVVQGCKFFGFECDPLPVKDQSLLELLKEIPEGTKVVFESNTGRLDTAVYGTLINKTLNYQSDGGSTRDNCDDQRTNLHYREQLLVFNNKFGLKELKIVFSSAERNTSYSYEPRINCSFYIDSVSVFDFPQGMKDSSIVKVNTSFLEFSDCDSMKIYKNNKNYPLIGKSFVSKKFGLIKLIYSNKISNDSVFTIKNILK